MGDYSKASIVAFLIDHYGPNGPPANTRITLPSTTAVINWLAGSQAPRDQDYADTREALKTASTLGDIFARVREIRIARMQSDGDALTATLSPVKGGMKAMTTPGGLAVTAVGRQHWEDITSTTEKLPVPPEMEAWLKNADAPLEGVAKTNRDRVATLIGSHVEKELHDEDSPTGFAPLDWLINAIAHLFQLDPGELATLGIKDAAQLRHLTPKHAMILSEQIAADLIEYQHAGNERGKDGELTPAAMKLDQQLDKKPIEDFFQMKDGVCRHYAQVAAVVFDVLKNMQSEPSQLTNVYSRLLSGTVRKQAGHLWVAFAVIQPGDKVAVMQIDPTWNEANSQNRNMRVDYTFGEPHPAAPDGLRFEYLRNTLKASPDYRGLLASYYTGCSAHNLEPGIVSLAAVRARGGVLGLYDMLRKMPETARHDCYLAFEPECQAALVAFAKSKRGSTDFTEPSKKQLYDD